MIPRTAGPSAGHDPLDPFDTLQDVLLAVEDLALDFGRRGAGPSRGDGQIGLTDIGRELDRNLLQRHVAEHDDHQDAGDDRNRPVQSCPDQVHFSLPGSVPRRCVAGLAVCGGAHQRAMPHRLARAQPLVAAHDGDIAGRQTGADDEPGTECIAELHKAGTARPPLTT